MSKLTLKICVPLTYKNLDIRITRMMRVVFGVEQDDLIKLRMFSLWNELLHLLLICWLCILLTLWWVRSLRCSEE